MFSGDFWIGDDISMNSADITALVNSNYSSYEEGDPIAYIADIEITRNDDLVITKENLSDNAITISDFSCNNGQLVGTAMMKQAEIEIINKEGYDLENKNFDLEVGVLINNPIPSDYFKLEYIEVPTDTWYEKYFDTGLPTSTKYSIEGKIAVNLNEESFDHVQLMTNVIDNHTIGFLDVYLRDGTVCGYYNRRKLSNNI